MSAHNVAEAGEKLSDLIDRAIAGEAVVITRDGKPVAEIRPVAVAFNEALNGTAAEMLSWLQEGRPVVRRDETEDAGAFISKMRDEEWDR